jgi:7,8-dihydropterin-6-yl-methyl-4-(beta-D-ribofuranosyl)aminobenzene 5'-phosphate synthase
MSLENQRYAIYWAFKGISHPSSIAAYHQAQEHADREWQEWQDSQPTPLADLGSVPSLSVLPLVDFYPGREGLAGEAGVSYLVTAGTKKILFDVGFNPRQEHPSPLLDVLGVSTKDLDAVFISHPHLDHVGGPGQARERTFALSAQPVDLSGVPAYVPVPMEHPSARVEVVNEPRALAPGVASGGPLTKAIWWTGPVAEHTMLVNVAGKGPVMIVGCGHPSLERLIARAEAVTGERLYGVVGGLHFPVTGSRVGKGRQNIIGNGKLPWQRITKQEVREAAKRLAAPDLGVVALSAHDSCDWSLDTFRAILDDRYRTIRMGEEITVA